MSHTITGPILRVRGDILITGIDSLDGLDSDGAGSIQIGSRVGVSIQLLPESDLYVALEAAYNDETSLDFDVVSPDGDTTTVSANVTRWEVSERQGTDPVRATFTLSITDSEVPADGGGGGGGGDPVDTDFANVRLLLHFDGANDSTTFTDSSLVAATMGGATASEKISTAQSKFGGASLYLAWDDNNSNMVFNTTSHRADYDVSSGVDFTAEGWFYPLDVSGDNWHGLMGMAGTNSLRVWGVHMFFGGTLNIKVGDAGGNNIVAEDSGVQMTQDAWSHVALVRHGDDYTLYLNGVSIATANTSTAPDVPLVAAYQMTVGGCPGFTGFKGYIDDFRYTVGVARYRTAFTPPTEVYPDSDGTTPDDPPWQVAFCFRNSAGYVTNDDGETYSRGGDGGDEKYPVPGNSRIPTGGTVPVVFGWNDDIESRNRSTAYPPELAGVNFRYNGAAPMTFAVETLAAGNHMIGALFGDKRGGNDQNNYWAILDSDGVTVLSGPHFIATPGDKWGDLQGNLYTDDAAAFAGAQENVVQVTLSEPKFYFRLGDPDHAGTHNSSITYMQVTAGGDGSDGGADGVDPPIP